MLPKSDVVAVWSLEPQKHEDHVITLNQRPCSYKGSSPTPQLQGFMAVIYPAVARVHDCQARNASKKHNGFTELLQVFQLSWYCVSRYDRPIERLGLGTSNHWNWNMKRKME